MSRHRNIRREDWDDGYDDDDYYDDEYYDDDYDDSVPVVRPSAVTSKKKTPPPQQQQQQQHTQSDARHGKKGSVTPSPAKSPAATSKTSATPAPSTSPATTPFV